MGAALEVKSKLDDLGELLEEMLQQTGGKLSLRERELADAALGMPSRSQEQT